jgi:hypothetical protein
VIDSRANRDVVFFVTVLSVPSDMKAFLFVHTVASLCKYCQDPSIEFLNPDPRASCDSKTISYFLIRSLYRLDSFHTDNNDSSQRISTLSEHTRWKLRCMIIPNFQISRINRNSR